MTEQTKCKQGISLAVTGELGCEGALHNKTSATYKDHPQYGQQIKDAVAQIELSERLNLKGPGYEPVSREVALQHIRDVEAKKAKIIAPIAVAVKAGKVPKERMGAVG